MVFNGVEKVGKETEPVFRRFGYPRGDVGQKDGPIFYDSPVYSNHYTNDFSLGGAQPPDVPYLVRKKQLKYQESREGGRIIGPQAPVMMRLFSILFLR